MDSDDDTMEAPPPEYLRMRRRSNTLPKEILRNLKDKHTVKTSNEPTELTNKIRKYLTVDSALPPKSPSRLPALARSGSAASSLYSSTDSLDGGSVKSNKKYLKPLSNGHGKNGSLANLNSADTLIDSLIDTSSKEAVNKQRGPLPRGSSLYESLMNEFGHSEEERDTLSPLPSPELRRKAIRKHKGLMPNVEMPLDSYSAPSSPANMRRRVHWSEDVSFSKQITKSNGSLKGTKTKKKGS